MKKLLLLLGAVSIIVISCDTPSDSFERLNIKDPASSVFAGGTVTGLRAETGKSGNIRMQWSTPDDIVDKHVIEKSLGDSLSFKKIAELEAGELQYIDSTREVRKNTYYRLSSYIELEGEEDVLYGSTNAELTFGKISNEEFEFLDESNSLQLSWNVDVPFYTHFIISSENVISEKQESTVRILAEEIEHVYNDPLVDIDFENRKYTITGIIESDGIDEAIVEKEITFDTASFFRPFNLEINILNEQDWEISWERGAFFANEIELVRQAFDEDVVIILPAKTTSYTDSLILDDTQDSMINQFRRYQLRFVTENGASESVEDSEHIDISQPVIAISYTPQNDPNSLTIYGSGFGNDRDLIKEFIIEKPHSIIPDRYVEIVRVDADGRNFQFTDTDVGESKNPVYRVRTVTSNPSEPATFVYSHDYTVDYSFSTGMNYVTSMEISSDKNYLVAVSFRSGEGNSILVTDIQAHQIISEIKISGEQISDITISSDDQRIYFSVPSDNSIYKADFPGGENIEKIIDDAVVNAAAVFNLDVSADNSFIVGTGGRGFVKKWNLDTNEADFLFAEYSTPTFYLYKNIAISPDGNFIHANNGLPFIMDAENGSVIESLSLVSQNVTDHQFSKDGNYVAFVSNFSSTHIYSTQSWERMDLINNGQRADFHPEKPILALSGRYSVYTYDIENSNIIDIISGENGNRPNHDYENKIMFIDDERVATISGSSTIQIWKKNSNQRRWKNVIY